MLSEKMSGMGSERLRAGLGSGPSVGLEHASL